MNLIIKYILSAFIFFTSFSFFGQTYCYKKDTIFLNYNSEVKNCPYDNVKFKWRKKEGLQFNLCGKVVLLSILNPDTLSILKLENFKISTTGDIKKKVQAFREETWKKDPPHKNDKAFQFYNKNDIFETYLIEIINKDRFVLYSVTWRNQDIQE